MLPIDIVVDPSWRMVQFYHIRERHWPPVTVLRQSLQAVSKQALQNLRVALFHRAVDFASPDHAVHGGGRLFITGLLQRREFLKRKRDGFLLVQFQLIEYKPLFPPLGFQQGAEGIPPFLQESFMFLSGLAQIFRQAGLVFSQMLP